MKDIRREILNQVAGGTISPEEAAARLEALEEQPSPSTSTAEAAPALPAAPGVVARKVRVVSQFGAAEIVGDPSVAVAVADGQHRARQEGDTMVIEHRPFEETDSFTFGQSGSRKIVLNGLDWQRRKFLVRMNPDLELVAVVQAGNVRVDGVHGPITCEVQAGSCRVADFRSWLNVSVQAGDFMASGRLDQGASKVRCEMGSVKVQLEKGSSVRITARTQLGKIAIDGSGTERALTTGGKEVSIGGGAGTLDIDCTMGNVKIGVD
jgi:hypothetical protein